MAIDYAEYTDEQLISRLRDGDEGVTDYLIKKYEGLVRSRARSMYLLGADAEDLIQEGNIGLYKALKDYDFGRDAKFYTFAELCISRQIYTAVEASRKKKHIPLNSYTSLYSKLSEAEGSDLYLIDFISDNEQTNPEGMVIDQENVDNLEREINRVLSPFEKQVLDLYLTGMGYVEIARVLGRDDKSTDNALQRIRTKLKPFIKAKTSR